MSYPKSWPGFKVRQDQTWNGALTKGTIVEAFGFAKNLVVCRVPDHPGKDGMDHMGFTPETGFPNVETGYFFFSPGENLEPLSPAAVAFLELAKRADSYAVQR